MFRAFEFCLPTNATKVPGARVVPKSSMTVSASALSVMAITRGGYDWTKRHPWMAQSALKNRIQQFVIDGEAVVLCLVLNRNMETRVHLTFGKMGR